MTVRHHRSGAWTEPTTWTPGTNGQRPGFNGVGLDDAGNTTVIWTTGLAGHATHRVGATRYAAASGQWGRHTVLAPDGPRTWLPMLAANGRGDTLVTWVREPAKPQGESLAWTRWAGKAGWAPAQVRPPQPAAGMRSQQTALADNGVAVLSWMQALARSRLSTEPVTESQGRHGELGTQRVHDRSTPAYKLGWYQLLSNGSDRVLLMWRRERGDFSGALMEQEGRLGPCPG